MLVGLEHVLDVEPLPTALGKWRRRPLRLTCRKRVVIDLFCFFVLSLFSVTCYAQYSGNIQGVISDPSGAAINGASVRLRNEDTGIVSATTSSGSGNYRFSSLPPGNYVVTAESSGFKPTNVKVLLSTSETKGINIALPWPPPSKR